MRHLGLMLLMACSEAAVPMPIDGTGFPIDVDADGVDDVAVDGDTEWLDVEPPIKVESTRMVALRPDVYLRLAALEEAVTTRADWGTGDVDLLSVREQKGFDRRTYSPLSSDGGVVAARGDGWHAWMVVQLDEGRVRLLDGQWAPLDVALTTPSLLP